VENQSRAMNHISQHEEQQFERMLCRIAKVIFWLIICAAIVSFVVTV
jgi:hypothetical protein